MYFVICNEEYYILNNLEETVERIEKFIKKGFTLGNNDEFINLGYMNMNEIYIINGHLVNFRLSINLV